MSAQEDVSKIDGMVMVGVAASNMAASRIDGMVMVGGAPATITVSKIDAFVMVGSGSPVQHEHLWTDEWTGPAERT